MKAIVIREAGGPEVMRFEDVPEPSVGPGQVLIRIAAAGINFSDVGSRENATPADLPRIMGSEASGTVVAVGPGVTRFREGDLVACEPVPGCYAEMVVAQESSTVKLPAGLRHDLAVASMLQTRTAYAMAYHAYPIKPGDIVPVHAGAGGVGLLLTQMAKQLGATVITTVGSDEKVQASLENGADHVLRHLHQRPPLRADGGRRAAAHGDRLRLGPPPARSTPAPRATRWPRPPAHTAICRSGGLSGSWC